MTIATEPATRNSFAPTLRSERFSIRDIAIIALIWVVLAILIDPRGDFPLNDDWAYGLPVKALVERGEIRFTDWGCPTLLAQMFWGALFCLPAGFSFTAARISTLVLGLVGLVGIYGILRQFGANSVVALFGVAVVVANPLYLSSSYTFMTDIPFLSVMIVSALFLIRGMALDIDSSIWVGLSFALVSVFIRQIGLAIFFGFVVAYPFCRGFGGKWFVQAVVPAVLAFLALKAFERGMIAADRIPRFYDRFSLALARPLHDLAQMRLGVLKVPIPRLLVLLAYLGLFTVPFSLLLWPSSLSRLSRRSRVVELGWVGVSAVVVTAVCVATNNLMPLIGNVIFDFGLGVRVGLSGEWPGQAPVVVALGMTLLSVLGAILALRALKQVLWQICIRPASSEAAAWRWSSIFLIATCAFSYGPPALAYLPLFDRYFLPVIPMAIVLIWQGFAVSGLASAPKSTFRAHPVGMAMGLSSLLLLLVFSVAGTHDYLDWNRERWSALHQLATELALSPSEIDGGWEYNNLLVNEGRLYKSSQERGLVMSQQERDGRIYGVVLDKLYRIAVSPAAGYEVVRNVPLSPWLPLAPQRLILMKKANAIMPAE
jgi:hypothetical protein